MPPRRPGAIDGWPARPLGDATKSETGRDDEGLRAWREEGPEPTRGNWRPTLPPPFSLMRFVQFMGPAPINAADQLELHTPSKRACQRGYKVLLDEVLMEGAIVRHGDFRKRRGSSGIRGMTDPDRSQPGRRGPECWSSVVHPVGRCEPTVAARVRDSSAFGPRERDTLSRVNFGRCRRLPP